ncbi:VWA domain-containing protein [Polaromonas sp. YR568]|uniref:vWA domain-containing protein n=1 Tax=Polaromonas sp. YR568 TaxID=1855301 RepID=UPI0031377A35
MQTLPPLKPAVKTGGKSPTIAWLRTLLTKGPRALQREHLRYQPQALAAPRLHLIVMDTSGSMRQGGRLALAKGHAARLIEQAARAGDHVGLLCFGGSGVQLVLPPGPARAAGAARVRQCGGGGGTPLRQALAVANTLLAYARRCNSTGPAWLWLLTDGRTLEQPAAPKGADHAVVLDFDDRSPGSRAIGRCAGWAARWGAEYRLASTAE